MLAETREVTLPTPSPSRPVVTKSGISVGSVVGPGAFLAEIAGTPVLAFQSPFGSYRDLATGDVGPDVRELQGNLTRVGRRVPTNGTLTPATMVALRNLYRQAGYALPERPVPAEPGAPATPAAEGAAVPSAAPPPAPITTPFLPASWWVGIPTLPATVAAPGFVVGQDLGVTPAKLAISTGQPVLDASLPPGSAVVAAGMHVRFEPTEGSPVEATVETATPGGPGDGGATPQANADTSTVIRLRESLDPSLVGRSGRITVILLAADAVLAAPLAALTSADNGAPALRVRVDGTTRTIPVQLGAQAQGWVEVRGSDPALQPGVDVVVG